MKNQETATVLSTGSGFLYEFEKQIYLITNGHNITGVHPETGKRLSNRHAGFPTSIDTKIRGKVSGDSNTLADTTITIMLYNDEYFLKPDWYVHPQFGYRVDVVAIPVVRTKEVTKHIKLFPINRAELDNDFPPTVSDDAFILGYPLDINGGMELPIWKRASIATEIGIDFDQLPKVLVDTATREGMSGSPVIYKRTGLHSSPDGDRRKDVIGTISGLLGIYSGRIGSKNAYEAQLGIVWKSRVIDEILKAKVIGDIEFQHPKE
ncbi:MAG: hypothetical protein ABJT40_10810 [Nonlabens ulvanivorans]|uniref:hypothetical protein n=1 Tax=Bacteroidota TaxID=976 RepID=UPI0032985698